MSNYASDVIAMALVSYVVSCKTPPEILRPIAMALLSIGKIPLILGFEHKHSVHDIRRFAEDVVLNKHEYRDTYRNKFNFSTWQWLEHASVITERLEQKMIKDSGLNKRVSKLEEHYKNLQDSANKSTDDSSDSSSDSEDNDNQRPVQNTMPNITIHNHAPPQQTQQRSQTPRRCNHSAPREYHTYQHAPAAPANVPNINVKVDNGRGRKDKRKFDKDGFQVMGRDSSSSSSSSSSSDDNPPPAQRAKSRKDKKKFFQSEIIEEEVKRSDTSEEDEKVIEENDDDDNDDDMDPEEPILTPEQEKQFAELIMSNKDEEEEEDDGIQEIDMEIGNGGNDDDDRPDPNMESINQLKDQNQFVFQSMDQMQAEINHLSKKVEENLSVNAVLVKENSQREADFQIQKQEFEFMKNILNDREETLEMMRLQMDDLMKKLDDHELKLTAQSSSNDPKPPADGPKIQIDEELTAEIQNVLSEEIKKADLISKKEANDLIDDAIEDYDNNNEDDSFLRTYEVKKMFEEYDKKNSEEREENLKTSQEIMNNLNSKLMELETKSKAIEAEVLDSKDIRASLPDFKLADDNFNKLELKVNDILKNNKDYAKKEVQNLKEELAQKLLTEFKTHHPTHIEVSNKLIAFKEELKKRILKEAETKITSETQRSVQQFENYTKDLFFKIDEQRERLTNLEAEVKDAKIVIESSHQELRFSLSKVNQELNEINEGKMASLVQSNTNINQIQNLKEGSKEFYDRQPRGQSLESTTAASTFLDSKTEASNMLASYSNDYNQAMDLDNFDPMNIPSDTEEESKKGDSNRTPPTTKKMYQMKEELNDTRSIVIAQNGLEIPIEIIKARNLSLDNDIKSFLYNIEVASDDNFSTRVNYLYAIDDIVRQTLPGVALDILSDMTV